MTFRRAAALTTTIALIGLLAVTGAATSATAAGEVDGLYSVDGETDGQFLQLDKTDATPTPVGTATALYEFDAIEVVDGVGYAIGLIFGPDDQTGDDDVLAVFTWNITTGAVLTTVPLTGALPINGVYALDTRLDGVLLTYAEFENGDNDIDSIASVNPVTGLTTPLIDLDLVEDGRIFEGIATNPVDGITYALADYDDSLPAASPIDFGTGLIGDSIIYEEIAATIGGGYIVEGDFDATGVLWFTYSGAGVSRTNAPIEVAVEATELGDPDINGKAITVGSISPAAPAPEPELAATGLASDAAPLVGAAAALLTLGGLLVLARRPRRS